MVVEVERVVVELVGVRRQDLPRLLDGLTSSSFNIAIAGLKVDKLSPEVFTQQINTWINLKLLERAHRNEMVHVGLVCEAAEFLFGELPVGELPRTH